MAATGGHQHSLGMAQVRFVSPALWIKGVGVKAGLAGVAGGPVRVRQEGFRMVQVRLFRVVRLYNLSDPAGFAEQRGSSKIEAICPQDCTSAQVRFGTQSRKSTGR